VLVDVWLITLLSRSEITLYVTLHSMPVKCRIVNVASHRFIVIMMILVTRGVVDMTKSDSLRNFVRFISEMLNNVKLPPLD